MEPLFHYATVTDAIRKLKEEGYTTDFNIQKNCLVAGEHALGEDEFEIVDIYRYEGETDPADEAIVYAVISKTGLKGTLVTGYGNNAETESSDFLKKLHNKAK